jgi:hypothetical protein
MQYSQDSRDENRAHECSEQFNLRCNAIRKDTEAFLRKIIPDYFTVNSNSGYTTAVFVEEFISRLGLDVAFDEVLENRDLVNAIMLQDD